MLLYLFFFISGLFVDKINNLWIHRIFLFCLYVFFCFGYTTGSDWRTHELSYDDTLVERNSSSYSSLYVLYNTVTSFFSSIGMDFWLYTGLCKCVFLYSVIIVIKLFVKKYFAILSIMLSSCLLFMLIDCPFKFMIALTFILFGFRNLVQNKYVSSFILLGLSLFMHFAAFVVVAFLLLGFLWRDVIPKMNFFGLFMLLFFSIVLSTSLSMFTSLTSMLSIVFPVLEQKLNVYSVESTKGWVTLGTLVNVMVFCIVYYAKNYILRLANGNSLYSMAILYTLLFPICLIIPTGFRFNMFNCIICTIAVGIVCFGLLGATFVKLKYRPLLLVIMILYYSYGYVRKIDTGYVYLPYTNSIPYILNGTSRDNYYGRAKLGYDNYFQRKGKMPEQMNLIKDD